MKGCTTEWMKEGKKPRQNRLEIQREMALNDFYVFIYEAPHLLLIAEIKTVFLRYSLPEILRHFLVAKKRRWLEVKKSQASNA